MVSADLHKRTDQLQQALDFERMLKGITEKVRDRLDESQILQTAVQQLGFHLKADCCNTAIYNANLTLASVRYEYTKSRLFSPKHVVSMVNFPEIYHKLLQGQYCHFCPRISPLILNHGVILACAICDNEGVLGDLWLFYNNDKTFDDLEIRLVQEVAYQCARAIRQARLYQASLDKVEELENRNRLKDDFLNTVSHELRTPVANMTMAIQMLEVALNKNSLLESEALQNAPKNSSLFRYFKILHDECEREKILIEDLLDLQRLEADSQPLDMTEIALHHWIPYVLEPFEERTRNHQQNLLVEISPELPPIMSDSYYLGRIFTELLNNAYKYTPRGEKIIVTACTKSGMVQVRVTNSGVEIPPCELPRIFDKFYRIPSSDLWKEGGTGLGLSLVQKLAKHLGGTIRADSSSGQTCFTLELPVKQNHL